MPGPSGSRKGVPPARFRPEPSDYRPLLEIVERAMQRVLGDIEATTPFRPTMSLEWGENWPSTIECWGFLEPRLGRAVMVRPSDGEEQAAALLADEMSEEVSEAFARDHRLDAAATWPRCPHHPHSLDAVVTGEHAVWRCRDDANIQVPIGSLRSLQ